MGGSRTENLRISSICGIYGATSPCTWVDKTCSYYYLMYTDTDSVTDPFSGLFKNARHKMPQKRNAKVV